jgi:general secretion pathway protein H
LVELLVVLLIMSGALLVVAQAFQRRSPELEVKSAAATLAAAFREARGLAIRDNQETSVVIDLDEHALRLGSGGKDVPLARDLGMSLYTAKTELVGEGAGGIRFFPDGTSTGGRVKLFIGNRKYDVVVDWLTGRADVLR